MVIVINGTLGVGKTWIARWLLCQLKNAAYIEGDNLGFVSPELIQTQSRKDFILEVALKLIQIYRQKGAQTIILDHLFEDPAQLESFCAATGEPVHIFYLSASPDTLATRIRKRGRPQADKEILEAPAMVNSPRHG